MPETLARIFDNPLRREVVEALVQIVPVRAPVMSLASWYDSIPFHFRILVFPLRR